MTTATKTGALTEIKQSFRAARRAALIPVKAGVRFALIPVEIDQLCEDLSRGFAYWADTAAGVPQWKREFPEPSRVKKGLRKLLAWASAPNS